MINILVIFEIGLQNFGVGKIKKVLFFSAHAKLCVLGYTTDGQGLNKATSFLSCILWTEQRNF